MDAWVVDFVQRAESGVWFEARRDTGTRIILHLRLNSLTLLYLFRRVRLWNHGQTVNQKIEGSFYLVSGKTMLNKIVFITTRIIKYISTRRESYHGLKTDRPWLNQLWEQCKDGAMSHAEKQMFWKQVAEKKKT